MPDREPEDLRRRVRRKKPKPPPVPPPPMSREERLLDRLARAMETEKPQAAGLTPKQRAWYRGTVTGLLDGLRKGAFRRRWKRDRDLIRRVQAACARWIEGTTDALPPEGQG